MSRPCARAQCVAAVLAVPLLVAGVRVEQGVSAPHVLQITLEDQAINLVAARFVARALRQAQSMGAPCLIIQLDTPGGDLDSTRRIVKDLLQADVPVVVYVAPPGARAASAGMFITLAAHVAAMDPDSHIGAAHPVLLGGEAPPESGDRDRSRSSNPLFAKIVNDTVAWVRALAKERGRNADWAARAVTESISATAAEAQKEHVIDFLATDEKDLLNKLDGRRIDLPTRTVVLHTKGAVVDRLQMSWPQRLLNLLAHPTLAYMLLMLGFYGLLFEITHPGAWAPGILGLICLALAFFALQMLPINWVGLALLALGALLLILEVKVHTLGLLTLVGVGCLVVGAAMLIEPVPGVERVSWMVVAPVSVATALIVLFLVGNVVRAHQARVQTGMDRLIGTMGTVRSQADSRGYVLVHGELWRARSDQALRAGQTVRVEGYEGLTLYVQAAPEQQG